MKARIAIIGAGWAGLACAHYLKQANYGVTVFEATRQPGGRAKPIASSYSSEAPLAIGQHVLVGAYTQTLALIKELNIPIDEVFYKQALSLSSLTGDFALSPVKLPVPLKSSLTFLLARGLKPVEKVQILTLLKHFKKNHWSTYSSFTVSQLLGYQPDNLRLNFWEPLCLLALNLPLEEACANLFLKFLQTIFDSPKKYAEVLIPKVALNELWLNKVSREVETRYNHTVRKINNYKNCVFVDGEKFDAIVLACSPAMNTKLLTPIHPREELDWNDFDFNYTAIATACLKFNAPVKLPKAMMMLHENKQLGHYGQWVFDRQALFNLPEHQGELTVVCGHARDLEELSSTHCLAQIHEQLKSEYEKGTQKVLPELIDSEWIFEKRATFQAKPGLARPKNETAWPRIFIAGDWTDTGYPGLLEGAVRSGYQAAQSLQIQLQHS